MAATTISRNTWTDDDGSGTTGTIIGNSRLQADVYDKVDALFSGASTFEFGGAVTVDGVLTATGAQLTTAVLTSPSSTNAVLTKPTLKGYDETVQICLIVAGVLTVNVANGNHVVVTLNANITTFSITNFPASLKACSVVVYFVGDGTQRTLAATINGVTVRWPSAISPTLTATVGFIDKIVYTTLDGGTSIYGEIANQVI